MSAIKSIIHLLRAWLKAALIFIVLIGSAVLPASAQTAGDVITNADTYIGSPELFASQTHFPLDAEENFASSADDPRRALTIEPADEWPLIQGGSLVDFASDIAVDEDGNSYLLGTISTTWGSPLRAYTAFNDVFVAKLDPSGALIWNTFLGGIYGDTGEGIAVDGDGNVYVTGTSSSGWSCSPKSCTVRPYDLASDAFVAKLDFSGVLIWNTFFGGVFRWTTSGAGSLSRAARTTEAFVADDRSSGIAVDQRGNIYVLGHSQGPWNCTPAACTVRAHTTPTSGGAGMSDFYQDIFVAQLDTSGTLVWNTFLGAERRVDRGSSIAIASNGGIYVSGESWDSIWGSPLRAYTGGTGMYSVGDAFLAKLDPSGALVWNTFLGGNGNDHPGPIALDVCGNIYVTGSSTAIWGAPLRSYGVNNIGQDSFIAKVDPSGTLVWNTFATLKRSQALGRPFGAYPGGVDTLVAGTDFVVPMVTSIVPAGPPLTDSEKVDFTVNFSEPVTGVNASDLKVRTTNASNAAISKVSGSSATYTVSVDIGFGYGKVHLDMVDDGTIVDADGNPLASAGTGYGGFVSCQGYTKTSFLFTDGMAARRALGQPNFNSRSTNTSQMGLSGPSGVAVDPTTGKVFVADQNNSRVLRFASAAALANGAAADAVLGQADFTSRASSASRSGMNRPYGVFVDGQGNLWVADTNNHRVLSFDNASSKASGANADGVLGQPDFSSNASAVSQNRMDFPHDVFVDSSGRLWVADRGNNRVLRFDSASSKPNGANADRVLGQSGFGSASAATTQSGMNSPTGVFVDWEGRLWVADTNNQRVLRFDEAASRVSGAQADGVLGQPDFTSKGALTTEDGMYNPVSISGDPAGRLYVSDRLNHRVLIFNEAASLLNGADASNVLGQADFYSGSYGQAPVASSLSFQNKVFFDTYSGILWVADTLNNRVLMFGTPVNR